MPSDYAPKKQFGKQKTYGKAVKTHLNGWFGRNLWTDIESDNSPAESEIPPSRAPKDKLHSRKSSRSTSKSRSTRNQSSEHIAAADRTAESSGDLDAIVDKLDSLGISEEEETASPSDRRSSIVVTDSSSSRSSASSVRESSDKENDANSSDPLPPATPQKAVEQEQIPLQDVTPRNALTERETTPVKESPPRKRGLRKRVSTTSTASSPLKNEVSNKENAPRDWEDPFKVWEDDTEDLVVVEQRPFAVVVEQRPSPKTRSSSKDEELLQVILPQTPNSTPSGFETPDDEARADRLGGPVLSPKSLHNHVAIVDTVDDESDGSDLSELSFYEIDDSFPAETNDLLRVCSEKKVLDFTEYIETLQQDSTIRKLGEASYSEVFLQSKADSKSTTVLKIIPFGQEEQCEVKSIVQEVRITKAMATVEGFIGFRGAYVVRGYFPYALLDEWDAYDEERGSENERPDFYEENQLFAVIMLENGGSDLEHTELRGWEEAADVFWQVAFALARGEKERQFEHRDLHFGNIVIRRTEPEVAKRGKSQSPERLLEGLSLEDKEGSARVSCLKTALIDYTLSRAYCGDLDGGDDVEFMPLDDQALFTGKGDYQFDIYRFMRNHVSSGEVPPEEEWIDWNVYAPRTNVFWLHYLTNILLTKMGIARPAARGRNAASEREKECFRQLDAVARAIDPRKKRFGKATIETSEQLVEWAVEEGLIERGI